MKIISWGILLSTLLIYSCSGEAPKEAEKSEVCTYQFSKESTNITWTAFKTSEKLAVAGTFDEIKYEAISSTDPQQILLGAAFVADKGTPNTNDPYRDAKLTDNFFNLLEGEGIYGKVISAEDGKGVLQININDNSFQYDFEYALSDLTYKMNFEINLDSLGAEVALNGIHEACDKLHSGKDNKAILWPTVAIEVVSTMKKVCN